MIFTYCSGNKTAGGLVGGFQVNSVYSTVTNPNALEICSSPFGPVDLSTVNDIISKIY